MVDPLPNEASLETLFPIAVGYVAERLSVIPLRVDGSKSPAVRSWKPYQKRLPRREELRRWFTKTGGIGLVCGVISGGLEVLDFDERPDETFDTWLDRLPATLRGRLCVCETGGLGYHVLYRCDRVTGNSKIAMTRDSQVLIESRGEGGYVVAVGSPTEVHESGNPYVQVRGEPLPTIPTLTRDERAALWKTAASLDERTDPMAEYVRRRRRTLRPANLCDDETPWCDFDRRADWGSILIPAGWTSTDGIAWARPGKVAGNSAKVCEANDGCEVLTVFSSNAWPLASQGMGHRTWGKFGAFAALNHGGDRRAAARAVRAKGYGRACR